MTINLGGNWFLFGAVLFQLVPLAISFLALLRSKRNYERFAAYARGRQDEFDQYCAHRIEEIEERAQVFRDLVEGHPGANVHGGMSFMLGPDGAEREPHGMFASGDVSEATAFWVMSGTQEAFARLEMAVAAAQAMSKAAE